jgi:TRAP transporter, DctM subunit
MIALLLLIVFLALIILGLPVFFSMGLITVFGLKSLGVNNMVVVAQKMFAGIDNFTYLCIPLFVLAGEVMSRCGMLSSIVRFCDSLVGHIRGGLAHVNVLGSMLFAGISGSATADATGLGRIEIEMMDEAGYDTPFSAAVTAASAIIGPIIPPSNIMIIYAVCASNVSVAAMFLGGIIPGIILGLSEMLLCYYFAIKYNFPRNKKYTWRERLLVTFEALPALGLPIIILVGIIFGIFTATEASAVAVTYAIIVAVCKKTMNWKIFYECCVNAAKSTANVLAIIGIASAMGYAITVLRIPQELLAIFAEHLVSRTGFLIFCNVLLLVMGLFLDQAPALLIMTPILLPLAMKLGVDPVQFGIIVCFNLTIGLITPPVGMTLFVTANVAKIELSQLFRTIIPFVVLGVVVLLLITFVPPVTTWLPKLL